MLVYGCLLKKNVCIRIHVQCIYKGLSHYTVTLLLINKHIETINN